jgi:hypothetical protein
MYYESQVHGLGGAFADAVGRTIAFVCTYPEGASRAQPTVHRALVPRLPYAVVYRFDRVSVLILAVAHFHRRPGYWRGRR